MTREGLPIAAYLGIMLALALAAAFVAVFSIVLWLPPRPPDVMRTDIVTDYFTSGYHHMTIHGEPITDGAMRWRIVRNAPGDGEEPRALVDTRLALAEQLDLTPDQIHVAASTIAQSDVFVFRVRDVEETRREAERAAREAVREIELQRAQEAVQEAREAIEEAQREREIAEAQAELNAQREMEWDNLEAQRERALELAERERDRTERQLERERARREALQARIEASREHAEQARDRAEAERERARERARERRRTHPDEAEIPEPPEPPEAPEALAAPDFQFELEVAVPPAPVRAPRAQRTPAPPRAHVRVAPAAPVAPTPPVPPVAPMFAPAPPGVVLVSGVEIAAELPDGRWLMMRQGRNWDEFGWLMRAGAIIGGALLVLSLLALLFARRLTRPIRNFSQAVQAVGVNPQSEPVAEEGPSELRGAARAVNTMQARLRALIADRTKTLAAVAHDMRTPLMRLRLAAENAPADQRDRMAKEIGEVEALVASFIAFARDDPAEEARVRLDLAALLQSIADDHSEAGRDVSYEGDERFIITGQSLGLKRLFANLIDNALKYGASARIVLRQDGEHAVVDVEDEGPGVPVEQREKVFEPFVRLGEGAAGAGLGLAAARSIAHAHGGDIVILDGETGARFRVTLPG